MFSVEDTALQVTWRDLGPDPVALRVGDTRVEVEGGGPGAVVIDGLEPDTTYTVQVATPGLPTGRVHQQVRTLAPPPGEELFRFATISDIHLGLRSFGYRRTLVERPEPEVPHPERCAGAALDELVRWGARLLVTKGDLTNRGQRAEWEALERLLAPLSIPVMVTLGNHDVARTAGRVDPRAALAHAGRRAPDPVDHLDVPGLRVITADSTAGGHHAGHVAHLGEPVTALASEAARTGLPVFLALHHYLVRLPVQTFWPPGVPAREAKPFLDSLATANPAALVTSGHTHRHRRFHHGPIVLTEVGSPKDYPGTWAGYVVHEGGIRQVVRRITRPDVLRWTDYTARAALGAWGLWSPSVRSHRCFSHAWPPRPAR